MHQDNRERGRGQLKIHDVPSREEQQNLEVEMEGKGDIRMSPQGWAWAAEKDRFGLEIQVLFWRCQDEDDYYNGQQVGSWLVTLGALQKDE